MVNPREMEHSGEVCTGGIMVEIGGQTPSAM